MYYLTELNGIEGHKNRVTAITDLVKSNDTFSYFIAQRRPCTTAITQVEFDGHTFTGMGVSKVSGKDWYDPKLGRRIALGKAVRNIVAQIMGESSEPYIDSHGLISMEGNNEVVD